MLTKLISRLRAGPQVAADARKAKRQGDEHVRDGHFEDAVRAYREALGVEPDAVDVRVGLGFALWSTGQREEAVAHLRHAISVDAGAADAHYILGTIASEDNDPNGAVAHFERAIAARPGFEEAHRGLATALLRQGRATDAKGSLGRAIAALPGVADFHALLGEILLRDKAYDDAIASLRKAAALAPQSEPAHYGLGIAHLGCGRFADAATELRAAIALRPGHARAHENLGFALQSQEATDDAIACYRQAVALDPSLVAAQCNLGNLLLKKGRRDEALDCYRAVLTIDPSHPVAHLVTALAGGRSERAPSEYVAQLFDKYAERFDSHLVKMLEYDVPRQLSAALLAHWQPAAREGAVLDLGCGTGLSGVDVAPYAKQLVGVDLSPKMLDKARERKIYHRLEQLDLLPMMLAEAAGTYDAIVAADVFVYIGRLDDLASEAHRLLRPGGWFAFSVESLDALGAAAAGSDGSPDYHLHPKGRYAHSREYLARLAGKTGFTSIVTSDIRNRLEDGAPVRGYLVLWQRASAHSQ